MKPYPGIHYLDKKNPDKPYVMTTCYDYWSAQILNTCEIDALLIGDSLGMVMLGYPDTTQVTLEEMIHHGKAVRRGAPEKFLVIDLPFMSYGTGGDFGIQNAARLIRETGIGAVKLEGCDEEILKTVHTLVSRGVPVMGHLGLTPQSIHGFGSYRFRGEDQKERGKIKEAAEKLCEAGVFSLVLECIPEDLAKEITSLLPIPTIGIGAGLGCDGQILVLHDLLGLIEEFKPKFVKNFTNLAPTIREGVNSYSKAVKNQLFPEDKHLFKSKKPKP